MAISQVSASQDSKGNLEVKKHCHRLDYKYSSQATLSVTLGKKQSQEICVSQLATELLLPYHPWVPAILTRPSTVQGSDLRQASLSQCHKQESETEKPKSI